MKNRTHQGYALVWLLVVVAFFSLGLGGLIAGCNACQSH